MKRCLLPVVFTGLSLVTSLACALEFKTIGAAPVILYDAPSAKGAKLFIAPRGMPVEIVLTYGAWSKVRDMSGELSWLESKELVARRNVIVRVANVKVRIAADDLAVPAFSADKNVLLEMAEPVAAGWVKVRHKDGQLGYVKVSEIWGI
jgi:SH3-like domain-containing protein